MSLRLAVAGVILLAFLGLAGVAAWYRGDAIAAQAEAAEARRNLDAAVAANEAQQAAISRMQATAAANERIISQMADQVAAINETMNETSQQIGELKDANEDVRAYLAGRVPADLDRVLNR
ncbi:hypothetical protein ACVCNR_00910 [Aquamicrobium terrae]